MALLIVEDEKPTAQRLKDLVLKIEPGINEIYLCHSLEEAIGFFTVPRDLDLILLDIELGDGTGFELLDALEHEQRVIFTTAYNEYAIKAFKYNAIDYLLKPIHAEELKTAIQKSKTRGKSDVSKLLDKLKDLRHQSYKRKFLINAGNKVSLIDVNDINYFYSEDGYTFIRTKNSKHLVDFSLDSVEEIIDPQMFFRINRKFIIHINSIHTIAPYFNSRLCATLIPDVDQTVIVARNRVKDFKTWVEGL